MCLFSQVAEVVIWASRDTRGDGEDIGSVSGVCRAAAAESLGRAIGAVFWLRGRVGGFAVNKVIMSVEDHPNLQRFTKDPPLEQRQESGDATVDGDATEDVELRDHRELFKGVEECDIALSSSGTGHMVRLCAWGSDKTNKNMRGIELRIYDGVGARVAGRVDWDVRTPKSEKEAREVFATLEHPRMFRREERRANDVGPVAPKKRE